MFQHVFDVEPRRKPMAPVISAPLAIDDFLRPPLFSDAPKRIINPRLTPGVRSRKPALKGRFRFEMGCYQNSGDRRLPPKR